jgi:quercetin dioxygenase-like cupin family protein
MVRTMKLEVLRWTEAGLPEERTLRGRLEGDGFEAFCWSDGPGASYTPHSHDHDESLWVVAGRITFGIAGNDYSLGPGDRLMLPRGTVHTALAGPQGATYLIGQRK